MLRKDMPTTPALILASTSVYRRELLSRLQIDFTAAHPLVDEEVEKTKLLAGGVSPIELAQRLSLAKGQSLANASNCVIAGDQICLFKGEIIGKSGGFEKSLAQLEKMQGETHELITAICVLAPDRPPIFHLDRTKLVMKKLTREQLTRYLHADKPYDCAGSYKIEKFGITLFKKIESEDFTAIQGLPLLALTQILNQLGYQIP